MTELNGLKNTLENLTKALDNQGSMLHTIEVMGWCSHMGLYLKKDIEETRSAFDINPHCVTDLEHLKKPMIEGLERAADDNRVTALGHMANLRQLMIAEDKDEFLVAVLSEGFKRMLEVVEDQLGHHKDADNTDEYVPEL